MSDKITDTAIDTTAVDQYREYPALSGLLVCDARGLAHINSVGVTANASPKAHRGHPDLTCITVTINGLGLVAMSLRQARALVACLRSAVTDAEHAQALSSDTP